MIGKVQALAAAAVVVGTLATTADAGVGYAYVAPSYSPVPPVYSYGYGGYPAYGGDPIYGPSYGFPSYGYAPYGAYGLPVYGVPSYGYGVGPSRFRPSIYSGGFGVYRGGRSPYSGGFGLSFSRFR